jgi:hypothetical protein
MIFCIAPVVSYALVFRDPPADTVTMQPVSFHCYAQKLHCDIAASAANAAFRTAVSHHVAVCEEQPAGDLTKPFTSIPFGEPDPVSK